MDACQGGSHAGGKGGVGVTVAQLRFPQGVAVGGQELHRQGAGRLVAAEQIGRRAGHGGDGALHPAGLVAVALDRGLPVRGHAQLCQRALDADGAGGKVDAPDV